MQIISRECQRRLN